MRHAVRRSLRLPGTIVAVAITAALPALATGWTWVNPSPTGAFVYAVSQSASGSVFVFAADGTASRLSAAGWQPLFCERAINPVRSVATPDGAVFVAGMELGGSAAVLLRWNGSSWDAVAEAGLRVLDLWASGARDAWMGGVDTRTGDAVVFRWDGTAVTRMVLVPDSMLAVRGLWGSSASDVWAAVASDGPPRLFHFDGKGWGEEDLGSGPGDATELAGLAGSGPQRPILVVVNLVEGTPNVRVWQKGPSGWLLAKEIEAMQPQAVSGTPDGTVAVSGWGEAYRVRLVVGKEDSWTEDDPPPREVLSTLSGTLGNGFLAVGGYDSIFERTASGWAELAPRRMDNYDGLSRQADGTLLLWGAHVITKEGLLVRREADGRLRTVATEPAARFLNVRTGPDGALWAVGHSEQGKYGFVYRSTDGVTWTKDLETPPGELLLQDVLPAGGAVRAVGLEPEARGPMGSAPMHVLLRAADGTWTEEFVTEDSLTNGRFLGGAAVTTLLGFDPRSTPQGLGTTLVFVRDAKGWKQQTTIPGITVTKDLEAGGGRILLLGRDNGANAGIVGTWDGAAFTVGATVAGGGGMALLLDIASAGSSGYLLPGWTSSAGNVLFSWDGVSSQLVVARKTPAPFSSIAAVSPTEIWLAGYLGRLMRFDGGGDLRAGRTPGVTVTQARHRPTVAADLAGWYGIPLSQAASDVMDAAATVPSGGWAELQLTWVPDRSVPVSRLRLWTVQEGAAPRMLGLDPGGWPMPDGGFELLDPSGRSLERTATLVPGTGYTVRFTVRDGGAAARHDLDPRPGWVRTSVLLTTY